MLTKIENYRMTQYRQGMITKEFPGQEFGLRYQLFTTNGRAKGNGEKVKSREETQTLQIPSLQASFSDNTMS